MENRELNRDEIVKALEYCFGDKPCNKCEWHEVGNGCMSKLEQSALSLINELTEENERLKHTISQLGKNNDELARVLPLAKKEVEGETAREIFEEIEDVLNNIGYFDEIDFNTLKKKYTEDKK